MVPSVKTGKRRVMLYTITFLCILHDPCLASKQINDVVNRGTNCIRSINSNLICDRNGFDPGWYSAVYNGEHLEIPTTCPGIMACGTGSPIWINGTYPVSVGETVNTTACARGFKQTDTCIATYHIEIKKCSGFYVYKLPDVDLCYSAFCFGNHTCERKVTTDKKESDTDLVEDLKEGNMSKYNFVDRELVEDPKEGSNMSKSNFVIPYLLSGFLYSVLLIGICACIVFFETKRMRKSNTTSYSPPCYKQGSISVIERKSVDNNTKI